MDQKSLSTILKIILIGFAVAGAIIYFWLLPMLGGDAVAMYPEFSHCY